jgi:hypothetical protein
MFNSVKYYVKNVMVGNQASKHFYSNKFVRCNRVQARVEAAVFILTKPSCECGRCLFRLI